MRRLGLRFAFFLSNYSVLEVHEVNLLVFLGITVKQRKRGSNLLIKEVRGLRGLPKPF